MPCKHGGASSTLVLSTVGDGIRDLYLPSINCPEMRIRRMMPGTTTASSQLDRPGAVVVEAPLGTNAGPVYILSNETTCPFFIVLFARKVPVVGTLPW